MKLKTRWGWENNFIAEYIGVISYVVTCILLLIATVIIITY